VGHRALRNERVLDRRSVRRIAPHDRRAIRGHELVRVGREREERTTRQREDLLPRADGKRLVAAPRDSEPDGDVAPVARDRMTADAEDRARRLRTEEGLGLLACDSELGAPELYGSA